MSQENGAVNLNPNEKSPVIKIGEGREVLAAKLKEYESRWDNFKPPELQLDTFYKIEVAKALLETWELNTWDLSRKLKAQQGSLNLILFNNACAVIHDYVLTGGQHTHGGTGLPKIEDEVDPSDFNQS